MGANSLAKILGPNILCSRTDRSDLALLNAVTDVMGNMITHYPEVYEEGLGELQEEPLLPSGVR